MTAQASPVLGSGAAPAGAPNLGHTVKVYGPHEVDGGWGMLAVTGDTAAWRGSSIPWAEDELPVVWFEMIVELTTRCGWDGETPVTVDTRFVR